MFYVLLWTPNLCPVLKVRPYEHSGSIAQEYSSFWRKSESLKHRVGPGFVSQVFIIY